MKNTQTGGRRRMAGFIALCLAMFVVALDSTVTNIALPDIMNAFRSNLNDASWISTIYVLGLGVLIITSAKIADQFGRKKLMLIGFALFGLSSALCGLSQSLLFLIAMRAVQSIGGAIILPLVLPMGLALFGKAKMRSISSVIGVTTAIAAAGGPALGGLIIQFSSWRVIFYLNVPLIVIALILTATCIDESYDETASRSIDFAGMLLLSAALFLLTFALLKGQDYGWHSALIVSMFVGSAVMLTLFLLVESRSRAPMMELGLFKERAFTASNVCYMLGGFAVVCPTLILNYFLQNILNDTALNAALITMWVSATVILFMPLGNLLAAKLGSAKGINVLGLLLLGAGSLLLSGITVHTSRATMIFDMVVCGFGLGFCCQSIITAVKFLPVEKSGMASGIINALRQIGTCIGIAVLVSLLNTNVTTAKTSMKAAAIADIRRSGIAKPVQSVGIADITAIFDNKDKTKQNALQNKLTNDIKHAMASLSAVPKPSNGTLGTFYDAANTLRDGTAQAADGQQALHTGIDSLSSGLSGLQDGSHSLSAGLGSLQTGGNSLSAGLGSLQTGSSSLSAGLGTLDQGLSQTLSGAQTLDAASSQGVPALSSGIGQINNGAQQLLSQFSSGGTGDPTLYDGVTGVSNGSASLSSNLNNYVSAVDNTYYLMITSNPEATQLLQTYQNQLAQAEAAYSAATGDAKTAYGQQAQALTGLVTLYTVGTDPTVTNEAQFAAKLVALAQQSQTDQNVVASGDQITTGTGQLSGAAQKVAAQFQDGGTFKSGMQQIANGTAQLNQNAEKLTALQQGLDRLTNGLLQLKTGSSQLLSGSQALQNGIASAASGSRALQSGLASANAGGSQLQQGLDSAASGSVQLRSGSSQLVDASAKIQDGTAQLAKGVGLAGQANAVQTVLNKVNQYKDDQTADAFDRVFLIAAIILFATCFIGLFTDREEHPVSQEKPRAD
ncbi:MFS transporter [Ethanoligenens harbinense]|uniref:Drug resistance transporter, EmrB/QacA subfamily n=1 Tax=Ethanoligenens harbinense (strain DSM 18485 / JCM 12961 / CGMCC 1.5033 / YUAN-3) TaxID=663278 RepID=E6U4S4_ETHHY|nr:MDR family MFS transporter [Ethanoligenens harbinense]ADU27809.1 drug resistance transporter, EmrB/QacA subfamily [Ethanoligenens harbinense YUAN-3]